MNNDIVKTQELLKKHPKISKNNEVKDNFDAFYYSVLNNKFTIVRVLLESGFDPNHKDQDMVSMLHWAAAKELVGIATLLIEKGANVSIRDSEGSTPLHWASVVGSETMVQLLIANGADIHSQDKLDYTPLDWAQIKNKKNVVLLLEAEDLTRPIKRSENRSKRTDILDSLYQDSLSKKAQVKKKVKTVAVETVKNQKKMKRNNVSNYRYKLISATYSSRVNANIQKKKLKEKGIDSYIWKDKKAGTKNTYKVQLGAFNQYKKALKEKHKLKEKGLDAYILIN